MAFLLLDSGYLTVNIHHSMVKDGTYYYYRRIPEDVRGHYGGKLHRRVSTKSKVPHIAAKKIAALASADDALWVSLRSPEARDLDVTTKQGREAAVALLDLLGLAPGDMHRPGRGDFPEEQLEAYFERRYGTRYMAIRHGEDPHQQPGDEQALFTPVEREAVRLVMEKPGKRRVHLTDALDVYLKDHDKGNDPKFARDNRRAVEQVIAVVGDFPLDTYCRDHATAVRDQLLAKNGKSATVRRNLNRIKAVFNHGLREFDLRSKVTNPFEGLKIANENEDADERPPFTSEELKSIGRACREKDDDIRHIVALQADTGARLGEIVGLRIEDVVLDDQVPHVHIRPHRKFGRTLKTANSHRKVPLVGIALWAADQAMKAHGSSSRVGGLFPRYAADHNIKNTHASNAINKWLGRVTGGDKRTHSFRHSMRDRLRHVNAPEDIQDAIGGWGSRTIGMGYGEGYRLEQLKTYLDQVMLEP